jgi:hypothetical protein
MKTDIQRPDPIFPLFFRNVTSGVRQIINKRGSLMPTPKRKHKIIKAVSKTTKKSNSMSSLRSKLKAADPEIQKYITALEAENLKCARQVSKLQAENVTLNNRIKVLEEEYPKKQEVIINVVHDNKPPKKRLDVSGNQA